MALPNINFPVKGGKALYQQYKELSQVALEMQTEGLHVDRPRLAQHAKDATERREKFLRIITDITGIPVEKVGKDGQGAAVKTWFWDTKGVPKISKDKKTKQPKLDTNGALLNHIEDPELGKEVRQAAAALIGYRKATKALEFCHEYDRDKVHPTFNVTGTKGARWSASGPNIQQLPSKAVAYKFDGQLELLATSMKDIIIPRPGYILLGSDYSALELYLQTYIAGATKLMGWIDKGMDLHLGNANMFFGDAIVPFGTNDKKKYKKYREVAKLAFGFAYCSTDYIQTTLKQMRGKMPDLTERDVTAFRSRYFKGHEEFPAWQAKTIRNVNENGFIEIGLMKRRLYLEPSNRGHNQALNAQCQTLGGDMLNLAVLALREPLKAQGARIALTWHDSIITETPINAGAIQAVGDAITAAMEGPFSVNGRQSKFVAEPDIGMNLQDMIPLPDFRAWIE